MVIKRIKIALFGPGEILEAVEKNDDLRVQELIFSDRSVVNGRDPKEGRTPLHVAVRHGHKFMVDLLLNSGADTSIADRYGKTPLSYAAEEGHADIAELLITRGADVNAMDMSGTTALHEAVALGHDEVVSVLLDHGANVHDRNSAGMTPLLAAAQIGNLKIVEQVVSHGADVNDVDHLLFSSRNTALHWAAAYGHLDVVKYLLDKGVDPEVRNADEVTPLQLAELNGQEEVASLLRRFGAEL